jgi:large subunit ribosomal protein L35Ae
MKGIVVQFRQGRHTVKPKHFLLDLDQKSREDAQKLIGKSVVWKSEKGKEIKGEIKSAHGNKGLVRAIFERGLPGQAITTEVEVVGN